MDPICLICAVPFRIEGVADTGPLDCPACGTPNAVATGLTAGGTALGARSNAMRPVATGRWTAALAVRWRMVAWSVALLLMVGLPLLVWAGHLSIDSVAPVYLTLASIPVSLAAVPLYFFPTLIAGIRKHRELFAILVLNVFLGWTYVGWVLALVWASLSKVR